MKQFNAFVLKEFHHLFRDIRTVMVIFTIPIIQLLLFGYVISTEIKDARIAVIDYSNDEISNKLTSKIVSSGYFILESRLNSTTNIEDIFKKGKIKEVIIYERDFGKKLVKEGTASIQILVDASEPNTATLLDNYTRSIIQSYQQELYQASYNKGIINTEFRMIYNEELHSAYMFVPGTMALILMLISALMTSVAITREKELGTMEVLLVSPLKSIQIILGKVVPYMVIAFIDMLVIIIIGHFVFGVPLLGSKILLLLIGTLFIFVALSLGILISTIAKTQQVAMIVSLIGLMLPTILLSGFIFPIENMPKVLQFVSLIMPPRWFLDAVKSIMLKGSGLGTILKDVAILFCMLVLIILASVRNFKIRLE